MSLDLLHSFTAFLHEHRTLAILITFAIAFAESLAVIGTIVPGSVTMTAVGALVGSGILPATSTIIWATVGAFVGDFVSYTFGVYFKDKIRTMWPFSRYPNWLIMGEKFFHKHGGKSVVFGRFVGPARSAVPLIAGALEMPAWRFALAAIPSACLWVIVYMGPGILLGALALELPPSTATKFILAILGIIAVTWLTTWFIHFFFRKIAQTVNHFMNKLWQYMREHRTLQWITAVLDDPRHPEHPQQLTLAFFAAFFAILFVILLWNVANQGFLTALNQPLFELMRSLRNRTVDDIMIGFTLMGDKIPLLIFSFIVLAWLIWAKYYRAAIHWLIITCAGVFLTEFFKHVVHSPRPIAILNPPASFSFPSGHTTLSLCLFGFLAVLIARELPPEKRKIPYWIAAFLVFFIGLSRVYLGVHWLTDVIGGLLIGFFCISVVTLLYRRKPTIHINSKTLTTISVSVLLTVWSGFSVAKFQSTEDDYSLYWPTLTIDNEMWWQHQSHSIPVYVVSRLGKPNHALNVEWLGSLDEIRNILLARGWQEHMPKKIDIKGTITELSGQKNQQHHLPIIPQLYQNKAPVMLMTKTIDGNKQLIFQLWKSNVTIVDNDNPLWVGNISFYTPVKSEQKIDFEKSKYIANGAIEKIIPDLKGFTWQIWQIPLSQTPVVIKHLNWHGQILLIKKIGN